VPYLTGAGTGTGILLQPENRKLAATLSGFSRKGKWENKMCGLLHVPVQRAYYPLSDCGALKKAVQPRSQIWFVICFSHLFRSHFTLC
jgi:hypothetical protein